MRRQLAGQFITLLAAAAGTAPHRTDRPIIGVLTTPTLSGGGCVTLSAAALAGHGHAGGSCFHSLYVQWIESSGGRVVPLMYDSPLPVLDELFDSVNGVLFTGGEANVSDLGSKYMRAAAHLLGRMLEANRRGVSVPLWGTCMGMQAITNLVSGQASLLEKGAYDSESLVLPLTLASPRMAAESRLLRAMPPEVLGWLTTENVTVNLHHDGVPPGAFRANRRLAGFFRLVSANEDRAGKPFASTIEALEAPVYGAQWHPERPQFQFSKSAGEAGINHGPHAVRAMQAVANFFVGEARQNSQRFPTPEGEASHLIYNYAPVGAAGDSYRAYHFQPAGAPHRRATGAVWV